MPLFEFECKKCGKKFEEIIKLLEKRDNINCPHCGSPHTEKLLSSFHSGTMNGDKSGGNPSCAPTKNR